MDGRALPIARTSITMHMLHLSPLGAALYAASAAARPPAQSEDATAQAAAAAAGTSHSAKFSALQLCQVQDQAGADGHATMKKTGRTAAAVGATSGPCVDPGSPVVPISPATPAPSPGKSS